MDIDEKDPDPLFDHPKAEEMNSPSRAILNLADTSSDSDAILEDLAEMSDEDEDAELSSADTVDGMSSDADSVAADYDPDDAIYGLNVRIFKSIPPFLYIHCIPGEYIYIYIYIYRYI